MSMNNYYPRLRDLREDRDMTQEQIAAYLGMKQAQYSRYERGLRDIPTDVLIRLALFYNTSTDYILGLTDDPSPYRRGTIVGYAEKTEAPGECSCSHKKQKSRPWYATTVCRMFR